MNDRNYLSDSEVIRCADGLRFVGPASLTKGKSEWSGNPADAFLDTTAPGQLYLYLRSKYVMSIFCS